MAMCCESRDASKNISNHTTLNQMVAFTYGGHFFVHTFGATNIPSEILLAAQPESAKP